MDWTKIVEIAKTGKEIYDTFTVQAAPVAKYSDIGQNPLTTYNTIVGTTLRKYRTIAGT